MRPHHMIYGYFGPIRVCQVRVVFLLNPLLSTSVTYGSITKRVPPGILGPSAVPKELLSAVALIC